MEILASLAATPPTEKVQRLRKGVKEEPDAFYNRVVRALLEGKLTPPKPKKGVQDPLHKRSLGSLDALRDIFGLTELEIRHFCDPVSVPHVPSGVLAQRASEDMKSPVLDKRGLRAVREAMWGWTTQSYWEHAEEAICNLRCLECPSATVLGCAIDNVTSSLADGFGDVRDAIMSM